MCCTIRWRQRRLTDNIDDKSRYSIEGTAEMEAVCCWDSV
ncbi:Protein of unknown function [Pyronema omphalodes CBS 100304]|uniref:Uncharacterized protein n=1 Tax=Pyronema omphalodes (strain CBS 100304) TaxID=1076935 RepID=U4LMI5_PYROM|nr:Protein of unknown function [Pyronema omphalodes CBS 100304]